MRSKLILALSYLALALPVLLGTQALAQDNTGLNVEELYILARTRAGKLDLSDPSTFSEKPTDTPRLRPGMKKVATAGPRGKRGFDTIMRAALERLPIKME